MSLKLLGPDDTRSSTTELTAAHDDKEKALERQLTELTGSVDEQLALAAQPPRGEQELFDETVLERAAGEIAESEPAA